MLKGDKIELGPLKREYINDFLRWFNDAEIKQYLKMYLPLTRDQEERWYENIQSQENQIIFSILLTEESQKKIIGNCGITIDWKNRKGLIGIMIGEKTYQNMGYGTQAVNLLLEYCFSTLNLHRIELEVYDFNTRAQKSYLNAGFKEEGRKRESHFSDGEYHDTIIMSILKKEWKKSLT